MNREEQELLSPLVPDPQRAHNRKHTHTHTRSQPVSTPFLKLRPRTDAPLLLLLLLPATAAAIIVKSRQRAIREMMNPCVRERAPPYYYYKNWPIHAAAPAVYKRR